MPNLKPCPHCGRQPQRHIFEDGSGYITCDCDPVVSSTTIRANWHRPDGKITKSRKEVSAFTEHEADVLWNSRPIEDEFQARIAELEAEIEKLKQPIICSKCNDHIVANDGAICEVCAKTNETIIQEFATMSIEEFALWQHQINRKTTETEEDE